MLRNNFCFVGMVASFLMLLNVHAATPESLSQATHKQVRVIAPKLEKSEVQLNTFAMAPNGKLWLCCSTAQAQPSESGSMAGVILIYDVTGEFERSIPFDFNPQAINFSTDGIPYIAGSGNPTRWIAIKQEGDVIQFAMEESEIRNFSVAVRFIDDKRAEFKWYYDEPKGEPMATGSYVRVEGGRVACSPGKECSTTECAKPTDAKNVTPVTAPDGP